MSGQYFPIRGLNDTLVAHEYLVATLLGEPSRPHAAFLCAKHDQPRTIWALSGHRSLRVTMDNTANMIPTIQNLLTILLS